MCCLVVVRVLFVCGLCCVLFVVCCFMFVRCFVLVVLVWVDCTLRLQIVRCLLQVVWRVSSMCCRWCCSFVLFAMLFVLLIVRFMFIVSVVR